MSASINKIRKGKAEGRLLEVLEKSPLEGDKQDVSMPGNVEDVLIRHFHTTGSLR